MIVRRLTAWEPLQVTDKVACQDEGAGTALFDREQTSRDVLIKRAFADRSRDRGLFHRIGQLGAGLDTRNAFFHCLTKFDQRIVSSAMLFPLLGPAPCRPEFTIRLV